MNLPIVAADKPAYLFLSLHDDGAGVYTGAYVYFMSPVWKPHWGGLLMVLEDEANAAIGRRYLPGTQCDELVG